MSDIIDYDFFRRKAQIGKLVIFVGAGVSRNVKGMPGGRSLYGKWRKKSAILNARIVQKKTLVPTAAH